MVRLPLTAPAPPSPNGTSFQWPLIVALAAPVVLATLGVLLFIGMELSGRTPSSIRAESIAEAAGIGNSAETLRRLLAGEDPARVQAIRPFIIGSEITQVTALEAAVFSRRVQLVQMLDDRGAIVGGEARRALACLALDTDIGEIVQYLAPDGPPACEPGAARALIVARSKQGQ